MKKKIIAIILLLVIILPMFEPICLAVEETRETTEILEENGYQYTVNGNNEVIISKYIGTETEIQIPSTIAGMPVVEIGTSAFKRSNIISLIVPEGIRKIGKNAFQNSEKLVSVNLADSVTDIEEDAFNACRNLTDVKLSKELKNVGYYVFSGCSKLENIELPEGMTAVGYGMFDGCKSLKNIKLPSTLTRINNQAFYDCESLEEIIIPEGVKNIDFLSFGYCTKLANVTLPSTLEGIDGFNGCTSLQTIEFPESLKVIDGFEGCTSLKSVIIPEGVKTISYDAFRGCTDLTNVTIPDSISNIWDGAFENCKSLIEITIPPVSSISKEAFKGCTNLQKVIIESSRLIGTSAFQNCTNLQEIQLPKNLLYIDTAMFKNCSNLANIEIPESVTKIEDEAFAGCTKLTSLEIPEAVTTISDTAFPEGIEICGLDGSYAQTYAQEHNLTFIKKCRIKFIDYNDTVLKEQIIYEGEDATAPEEEPTREGYTFKGWDKNLTNVASNLEINAVYDINKYTVTFKNYDGTVLKQQEVEHGSEATAPPNPTKTGHTFTGWNKKFDNITSNLEITAMYDINEYTVIFKSYDNTILKTEKVQYGANATAPEAIQREGYTFKGWDKTYTNISSDLEITATYTINKYIVTFKDYNGTTIEEQEIEYGSNATRPQNPSRIGYTFSRWDTSLENIKSNTVITAEYTINKYKVIFKDYDGTQIGEEQEIEYLGSAVAPEEPTRRGYNFEKWDKDFTSITENTEITATYTKKLNIWNGGTEEPTYTRTVNGKEFYEIENAEQLAYIAETAGEWLNKNYILVDDIILNNVTIEYNKATGNLITNQNELKEWKPIAAINEMYTGIFDGNNHTVSGMYINDMNSTGIWVDTRTRGNRTIWK